MNRLLALALLAGCSPTSFTFSATMKSITPKPENCPVEVMTSPPPTRDFQEVGTLDFYNGEEPKTLDDFKSAVHKQVCQVGGDAAIAIADNSNRFTKGTVIVYTDSGAPHHPAPPKDGKPREPEKPSQVNDNELPK